MMTSCVRALICLSVLWIAPSLTAQDENPGDVGSLRDEVAELNKTMKTIAGLLERQLEARDTELLIRRFEWSQRLLSPKEERLRQAKRQLSDFETEEVTLAENFEMIEKDAQNQPENATHVEQMKRSFDLRLSTIERQKRELSSEIAELENEVASQRETLDLLEEVVDARLGLQ